MNESLTLFLVLAVLILSYPVEKEPEKSCHEHSCCHDFLVDSLTLPMPSIASGSVWGRLLLFILNFRLFLHFAYTYCIICIAYPCTVDGLVDREFTDYPSILSKQQSEHLFLY